MTHMDRVAHEEGVLTAANANRISMGLCRATAPSLERLEILTSGELSAGGFTSVQQDDVFVVAPHDDLDTILEL